ncbi:hypothetical protein RFI_27715 [Reticulomyxa filosa]|uniref:Uncharacterized protein n=1 Tax=Reticulomyxa filosa TaxID=46433 RepID=X6M6P2_RETFI|nr:hypothetical protein RFI_27715 [Reticulomyxa filosa]|eukprot:ETO09663.1 hypothetical protein RFI_27715 [Reticulomyxa filosa]
MQWQKMSLRPAFDSNHFQQTNKKRSEFCANFLWKKNEKRDLPSKGYRQAVIGVQRILALLETQQDGAIQKKELEEAVNECLGDKQYLLELVSYKDKYGNSTYDLVTCCLPREIIPMEQLLVALRKGWQIILGATQMISELNVPTGIIGYIIDDVIFTGQFVITFSNQLSDFEQPISKASIRRSMMSSLISARAQMEKMKVTEKALPPKDDTSSIQQEKKTSKEKIEISPRFRLSDIVWPERPISRYNYSYWCSITGIEIRDHIISVYIDEHGDNTLGYIQDPKYSKLKGKGHAIEYDATYEQKYRSFTVFDLSCYVSGKITYVLTNEQWYNLIGQEDEWKNITFSYGSSGYGFVPLFGKIKNSNDAKDAYDYFIEEMCNYFYQTVSLNK